MKAALAALVLISAACPAAAAGPVSNFAYMEDLTECQVQYLVRCVALGGDYSFCLDQAAQYAC